MHDVIQETITAEMEVPRRSWGATVWLLVCYAIPIIMVVMPIVNFVFHLLGMIADPTPTLIVSGISLLIAYWLITTSCRQEGGIHTYLINRGGDFARKQFAQIVRREDKPPVLRFGYRLFGRQFQYIDVPIDQIASVECNAGQASGMAGHDMNERNVCLWFESEFAPKPASWSRTRKKSLYIVGPTCWKQDAEAFTQLFIEFLRSAGVSLVRTKDEGMSVRYNRSNTNG